MLDQTREYLLHDNVGVALEEVAHVDVVTAALPLDALKLLADQVLPVLEGKFRQLVYDFVTHFFGRDANVLHVVKQADEVADARGQETTRLIDDADQLLLRKAVFLELAKV